MRTGGPEQPPRYARWIGSAGLSRGLSRAWLLRAVAVGLLAASATALVISSRSSGIGPAAVLTAAFVTMLFVYLVLWREVMVRVHQYLLTQDQLGDARRVLLFFLAFLAFPAVTVFVALAIGLLSAR